MTHGWFLGCNPWLGTNAKTKGLYRDGARKADAREGQSETYVGKLSEAAALGI